MVLFSLLLIFSVPVAVFSIWILSLKDRKYRDALYKLELLRNGFGHMLLSSDKRMPKTSASKRDITVLQTKSIIFVRHAESQWNEVFNKGFGKTFPTRLGNAFKAEANMFASKNSVFVDSPLSKEGSEQAIDLQNFIDKELNDEVVGESSIIVSSNLRRALTTGAIGFKNRLRATKEKIKLLSSLQEVTFNLDGLSIAKPFTFPLLSEAELKGLGCETEKDMKAFDGSKYFDPKENMGNKKVKSSGFKRMFDFAQWCFTEENEQYESIIANGHSLYFRFFFQYFLNAPLNHIAKKSKMKNCSVIKFELQRGKDKDGKIWFNIPEESMMELYLGFEQPKSSKKKN